MKFRRLALTLTLALACAGCNDPYGTAAKLAQDVAVSVNQASTLTDQLRSQGTLTPLEERQVLGYLGTLNTLDGQYIGCVQAAHTNTGTTGGFTACAQTLATGIGNPSTLPALHVVNPTSQQKVIAAAQAILTLVTVTVTALGGK